MQRTCQSTISLTRSRPFTHSSSFYFFLSPSSSCFLLSLFFTILLSVCFPPPPTHTGQWSVALALFHLSSVNLCTTFSQLAFITSPVVCCSTIQSPIFLTSMSIILSIAFTSIFIVISHKYLTRCFLLSSLLVKYCTRVFTPLFY